MAENNSDKLRKGALFLLIAFILFFCGPVIFNMGIKAVNLYKNYVLYVLGIILMITAVLLAFRGIKYMIQYLFNK